VNTNNLSHTDLRALLACARELSAVEGVADFHRHVCQAVQPLLGDGWVSSELGRTDTLEVERLIQRQEPLDAAHYEALDAHLAEHPFTPRILSAQGGDLLTTAEFDPDTPLDQLGVYHDFYRHLGIRHQIMLVHSLGHPYVLGLSFNRDKPYTDEERCLVESLRPHLLGAYDHWRALRRAQGAEDQMLQTMEELSTGLVLLDSDGKVRRWTCRAEALLETYFDVARRARAALPSALARRVRARIAQHAQTTTPDKGAALAPMARGRLTARLIRQEQPDGWALILEEARAAPTAELLQDHFGLSPRRANVLHLLGQGKTNTQIGAALGISPRTVGKHLEHIYRALDVDSRAAAVARAVGRTHDERPVEA